MKKIVSLAAEVFGTYIDQAEMEHKKHKAEHKKRKEDGKRLKPFKCFVPFVFCFVLFVLKPSPSSI